MPSTTPPTQQLNARAASLPAAAARGRTVPVGANERLAGPLLVLITDRLTQLINKGEVTDRYYNPGDLFTDVHLVLCNDDAPDPRALQRMVGTARLTVHTLPAGISLFARTIGWRPTLLKNWAAGAVTLAREVRPSLVRCHGASINAYAALMIRRALGTRRSSAVARSRTRP